MGWVRHRSPRPISNGMKRILLTGLVLLAIFVITLTIFRFRKKESPSAPKQEQSKKNPLLEDWDKDGLQNWEEQVYGTDSRNPDTDGDGKSDGDEIKTNTNPLIKDAGNATTTPQNPPTEGADQQNPNLTQTIFDEFLKSGGLTSALQGNKPLASQIISQKIDELVKSGYLKSYSPLTSASADIKTSPNISPTAIKNYLNKAAKILETNLGPLKTDDLDLLLDILQTQQLERLAELAPYREAYQNSAIGLRAIEVPKTMVWFHSKEIQYLEDSSRQLQVFENTENDPLSTLTLIPGRVDLKIAMIKLNRGELKIWLDANKITLSPSDKAYAIFIK